MSIREWPRPVRLALAWLLLLLAAAIVFVPAFFLVRPFVSGRFLELGDTPWSNILAHYSTLITAPVAVACAVAAFRHYRRKGDRKFAFFFLLGAVIGLAVGLLLAPATGGLSILIAPPFAGITMIAAWAILAIARPDAPNPPTPAP